MQLTSLLTLAMALVAEANIAFTHTPGSSVQVGQPFTIMWDGADDNSSVTITLKKGNPQNLQTVALLTGDGQNGKYTWTPDKSLPNGDDYALEISQGTGYDESNYSGEFSISGGSSSASSSASSSSSSGSSGAGGVLVTITSGSSTYTTTEASGMMTGTASGMGNMTRPSNSTFKHTQTPTTGGIQVTSAATVTATTTKAQATSTSAAGAAALGGSIGGLAAFVAGFIVLV